MDKINLNQLESNFENIIEKVESGEKVMISYEDKNFLLMSYREYDEYVGYYEKYFNHNDAP